MPKMGDDKPIYMQFHHDPATDRIEFRGHYEPGALVGLPFSDLERECLMMPVRTIPDFLLNLELIFRRMAQSKETS